VYAGWHTETLKSQAVAARTFALFHTLYTRQVMPERAYDVDDSVSYQAYSGLSQLTGRTSEAVMATAGEILMHDAKVIQAYYHADSGGTTEDGFEAWGFAVPYCRGQHEEVYREQPATPWQVNVNLRELAHSLRDMGLIPPEAMVTRVTIDEATHLGRVKSLEVITRTHEAAPQALRLSIGQWRQLTPDPLPSTLFQLVPLGSTTITIVGRGAGHGIGLNQTGAELLATKRSLLYRQILAYYYSETNLCTLNPLALASDPTPSCLRKSSLEKNSFPVLAMP